jgi:hypothetical protein
MRRRERRMPIRHSSMPWILGRPTSVTSNAWRSTCLRSMSTRRPATSRPSKRSSHSSIRVDQHSAGAFRIEPQRSKRFINLAREQKGSKTPSNSEKGARLRRADLAIYLQQRRFCGSASNNETDLYWPYKAGATGSIPVAPTMKLRTFRAGFTHFLVGAASKRPWNAFVPQGAWL